MQEIRFDDIEGLKKQIKDDYSPWGPEQQVTQEMINGFAELTGDHQWIHVDVERCKRESPFGGPIAHGFLTLADRTLVLYLVSAAYDPARERGVRWDDPAFALPWPFPPRVISPRDAALPDFAPAARCGFSSPAPAPSPAPGSPKPSPGEAAR